MPYKDDLLQDEQEMPPFVPERMFTEEAVMQPKGWAAIDLSNLGVFNPDDIPMSTYKKMLKDTTVGSAFDILRMSVLFVDWNINYDGKDPQLANDVVPWLEDQLSNLNSHLSHRQGVDSVLMELMTAIAFGVAVGELVFSRPTDFDDRVGLRRIKIVDPESLQAIRTDQFSNLLEIRQNPFGRNNAGTAMGITSGMGGIGLDPRKLLVYSYNMEFGNWWGQSDFRRIYEPWFVKQFVQKFWNIALEKFGLPYVVGKVGKKDDLNQMLKMLNQLQKRSNVAITADKTIELLKGQVARGEFMEALEYQNREIMKGLLIPALVFESQDVGAFAQSKTHFSMYLMRIKNLQKDLEKLMNRIIKTLVDFNYANVDVYPTFSFEEPSGEDTAILAQVFNTAIQGGYLDPKTDMDWIRKKLGFPEATPEFKLQKEMEPMMAPPGDPGMVEGEEQGPPPPQEIDLPSPKPRDGGGTL